MSNAALLQSLVGPQKPKDLFASLLLKNALDTSPVQHWTQGAARMAQALLGGLELRNEDAEAEAALKARMNAPGLGGGPMPEPQQGMIPRLAQQLMGGQQEQPQPPQPNLGPVTSGPRPPNAPPAYAGREMIGGMPIYNQNEVNPMDVAGAGHGNAIASIESGGRYNTLGPVTGSGDRAYGKFQVMGRNVPSFTREATGSAATPQQFLANPDLQESTFNAKFADYINRYGSPEAAARAWFAGEGGMNDLNRRDQLGTTVGQYGQRFAQAAGAPPVMAQGGQPQSNPTRAQIQIPPEVASHIRALYASRNPANIAQADALYQQYAKPVEQWEALTPEEKIREGIQPTDTNPYRRNTITREVKPVNPQPFAVNVNQQQESEFRKEAGKLTAKRYDDIIQQGRQSQEMVGNINMLREIGTQFQTGKIAQAKALLGPYAEAIGIPVKDLASIQSYDSLVQRVAPSLRVPGSGAQSDFELRAFLKSLPGVGNTPEGNAVISNTLQALSEHRIAAAEIAGDALTGDITQKEAEKRIRELKDPLTFWKEFRKTSPVSAPAGEPAASGGGQPSIQEAYDELKRRGLVK